MIKLTNMINELNINKPINNSDIFNTIIEGDEDGYSLIQMFYNYKNLEEYIEEWDEDSENINYAKWYYKMKDNNNIYVFEIKDTRSDNITFPKCYKYCTWLGLGYNNALIIMHNFL